MPMTILVDMDDVLDELLPAWLNRLNLQSGTNISVEDVKEWDLGKVFPNLSREQLFKPLKDPMLWAGLERTPGAHEGLMALRSMGHTIKVVTASHYSTVPTKMLWLLQQYPFLKWEDVIIASDKSLVKGDIAIDDGIHNLAHMSCVKLLFDRPHNRNFDAEANGMIRVHTWDEVVSEIVKLGA